MDVDSIRIFVEVARLNSFSKAARSLNQSSSGVSSRIQKLEQDLGIRLFDRTTRAVHLTEIGEQMLVKANTLLTASDAIEGLAASQVEEPQGLLRICAPPFLASAVLGDWLIEFQLKYPKVETEMIYSNVHVDLQEHHLDFGFRQSPLPNSNLIARKLFEYPFGVFASPQFLASIPPITHPDDFTRIPCIEIISQRVDEVWQFQNNGHKLQLTPRSVMKLEDPEIVRRAALAGIGATYIPSGFVEPDVQAGLLVPILKQWWAPAQSLYLVYSHKEHMTAKNRLFIGFILHKFSLFSSDAEDVEA